MKTKLKLKQYIFLSLTLFLSIFLIIVTLLPDVNQAIEDYKHENLLMTSVILAVYNTISIVIPPLPSVTVNFVAVKYYSWPILALLVTGAEMVGYALAFLFSSMSHDLIYHLFPNMHKFDRFKKRLNTKTNLVDLTIIQFLSKPAGDYMAVFAGILRLNFPKFMIATVASTLPYNMLLFYMFNLGWSFDSKIFVVFALVAALVIILKKIL